MFNIAVLYMPPGDDTVSVMLYLLMCLLAPITIGIASEPKVWTT
jgi:hypothetical protein